MRSIAFRRRLTRFGVLTFIFTSRANLALVDLTVACIVAMTVASIFVDFRLRGAGTWYRFMILKLGLMIMIRTPALLRLILVCNTPTLFHAGGLIQPLV